MVHTPSHYMIVITIVKMIIYRVCGGSLVQQKTRYPKLLWRLVALR